MMPFPSAYQHCTEFRFTALPPPADSRTFERAEDDVLDERVRPLKLMKHMNPELAEAPAEFDLLCGRDALIAIHEHMMMEVRLAKPPDRLHEAEHAVHR